LWLIVKGTEICPTAPTATISASQTAMEYKAEKKEYLNWLLRDEAAQGVMKGACKNLQLPHVKNCKLAKDTVQFRIVHHPYVTVTHLMKFSFC
jgi:hypothetical protein